LKNNKYKNNPKIHSLIANFTGQKKTIPALAGFATGRDGLEG
jgi:hypothetical protein